MSLASLWEACPKIMSHKSFVHLAVLHRAKMVTELLDDNHPVVGLASKTDVAKRLVEECCGIQRAAAFAYLFVDVQWTSPTTVH